MVDWTAPEYQMSGRTSATMQVLNPQEYEQDRGTLMDFVHDSFVGLTEAVDLLGTGLEVQQMDTPLRSWADTMRSWDLYKPDMQTYYGDDSWGKRLASGVLQSAPVTLTPFAAGAVGSLAGPVGGAVAGLGTMATMFGSGIYGQSLEEGAAQGMTGDELRSFARKQAASELLTEAAGSLIPVGILGRTFGKSLKNVRRNIRSGKIKPEEVISKVSGQIGVPKTLGLLMGSSAVEGGSEVINSLYQNYNRATSGLEVPEEDLGMTFAVGAALGGGISGASSVLASSKNREVRRQVEQGLQAEDPGVRLETFDMISQRLRDPELKNQWEMYRPQIEEGPVEPRLFEDPEKRAQRKREKLEAVLSNPEEILRRYGIIDESGMMGGTPFREVLNLRARGGQQFTTNLRTTPLDPYISEALTNDPTWVTQETLRDFTSGRNPEPTNLSEIWERNRQNRRLSEGLATRDFDMPAREPVERQELPRRIPAGSVQESIDRQDDLYRDLPPQTQARIEGERDLQPRLDMMAEGPTTSVTRDLREEPVVPEEGRGAAGREIAQRAEWTRGRVGQITNEAWMKMSPERAAQFREILQGIPRTEASVRERIERGIFVPREELQMFPELVPEGQEITRFPQRTEEVPEVAEVPQEATEAPTVDVQETPSTIESLEPEVAVEEQIEAPEVTLESESGAVSERSWVGRFSDGTIAEQRGKQTFLVRFPDGELGYHRGSSKALREKLTNEKGVENLKKTASERLDERGEVKTGRPTIRETEAEVTETPAASKEVLDEFIAENYSTLSEKNNPEILSDAIEMLYTAPDVTEGNIQERLDEFLRRARNRRVTVRRKGQSGVSIEDLQGQEGSLETMAEGTGVMEASSGDLVKWPKPKKGKPLGPAIESNDGNYGIIFAGGRYSLYKRNQLDGTEEFVDRFDTLQEAQEEAEGLESLRRGRQTDADLEPLDIPEDFFSEEVEETTIGEIIEKALEKNIVAAQWLDRIIPKSKRNIRVVIDPTATNPSYRSGTNTVTLNDPEKYGTALHEVLHSVTVRELLSNPRSLREVEELLDIVRDAVVDMGIISASEMTEIRSVENSQQFREVFRGRDFGGQRSIAYALQDPFEFLAQVINSRPFQNVLSKIEVPSDRKTSIFDKLIDWFMRVLGIKGSETSALRAVMRKTGEIVRLDPEGVTKDVESLVDTVSERPKIERPKDYRDEVQKSFDAEPLTTLGRIKEITDNRLKEAKETLSNYLQPISDAISAIDRSMGQRLAYMDGMSIQNYTRYRNEIRPFLQEFKDLEEGDQRHVSMALYNNNFEEAQKFIKKESLARVIKVLDELDSRARAAGMTYAKRRKAYFPRRVKDLVGYIDYLHGDQQGNYFREAFEARKRALGIPEDQELPESDRMKVISEVLVNGTLTTLPKPGATKKRTVPWVTGESYKYYGDASSALVGHIFEMNEKVSYREFAGASQRNAIIKEAKEINKKLQGPAVPEEERQRLLGRYSELTNLIDDENRMLEHSIAGLMEKSSKNLSTEQEMRLRELLTARLRPRAASGWLDDLRNVGYMTTLGNFTNAIKQLSDIPIAFYANYQRGYGLQSILGTASGVKKAFSTVGRLVSNDIKRRRGQEVTEGDSFVESMDFTNALREFSSGSYTSKMLETLFTYSGLKYADLIGKETFMQGAFERLQRMEREEFNERYGGMFDDTLDQAWANRSDNTAESTRLIVFSELSQWQPTSMSQQSMKYVTGGNLRLFYMLKTFQLRATNAAIREGVREYDQSQKTPVDMARMAARIGSILMIYAIAGASTDELRDLITGKPTDFSDNVMDNVFGLFLVSRFDAEMGISRDQLVTKIVEGNLPPVRWMDQIGGDLYSIFSDEKEMKAKSLNLIPLVGNLLYGYSPSGRESEMNWRKKDLSEKIRETYKDNGDISEYFGEVSAYNSWAYSHGETPIDIYNILSNAE